MLVRRVCAQCNVSINCGPVLVVDDDEEFCTCVSSLLARAGYATAVLVSAAEVLARVQTERPALVVLDVSLQDTNGFELCRELRDTFGEEVPIILVSGERVEALDRAVGLLIGADDYIIKPFDADEFLARARRAIVRAQRDQAARVRPDTFRLTRRELEVLNRLAYGQEAGEIARELFISPKTVASHLQRILAKLGAHSRAQAVAIAYQFGLLEQERQASIGLREARW
jgi:DNA-binding NarL/FixJ family response regulator